MRSAIDLTEVILRRFVINLVTGGAGFIGSNLINKLMEAGEDVLCLDDFSTGDRSNLQKWLKSSRLKIIEHDVSNPIELQVHKIWHLACPASIVYYQKDPIKTSRTCFLGTNNMLDLAKKCNSKFLLASTSEVYGDPECHPQAESYNGSINPIGLRSCYGEGKRIAESLSFDYFRVHNIPIRIARIFNTYGPHMSPYDGRVISNFIYQSLNNKPITIYGDGTQMRSFCYVDDLVDGLVQLMNSEHTGPINLGNPTEEYSILELAKIISKKINPKTKIVKLSLPKGDPRERKPLIDLASSLLDWNPSTTIHQGLEKTIQFYKNL